MLIDIEKLFEIFLPVILFRCTLKKNQNLILILKKIIQPFSVAHKAQGMGLCIHWEQGPLMAVI